MQPRMEINGRIPQEIIQFLESPGGHSLVIKGSAGAGKTTFSLQLIEELKEIENSHYLSTRVSDESLFFQFPWLKEKIKDVAEKVAIKKDKMGRSRPKQASEEDLYKQFPWLRKRLRDFKYGAQKISVDRTELKKLEGQIEIGCGDALEENFRSEINGNELIFDLGTLMPEVDVIYEAVEKALPKKSLVIIDSIDALSEKYGIPTSKLVTMFQKDLVENTQTNVLYVVETSKETHLDYLGDGIATLLVDNNSKSRRIRIMDIQKLRGREITHPNYLYTLLGGKMRVFTSGKPQKPTKNEPWEVIQDPNEDMVSTGCSDLDSILGGGFRKGSINLIEIGRNINPEHSQVFEFSLTSNFISCKRGVIWIPSNKVTSKGVKDHLSVFLDEDIIEKYIRVYERHGHGEVERFSNHIGGGKPDEDLEWRSAKYDLSNSKPPILLIAGLDTLEAVYRDRDVIEDLSDTLTFIKRAGDIFVGITYPASKSVKKLADLAQTHIKMENLSGTTVFYGEKPFTEMHALELNHDKGYPKAILIPVV